MSGNFELNGGVIRHSVEQPSNLRRYGAKTTIFDESMTVTPTGAAIDIPRLRIRKLDERRPDGLVTHLVDHRNRTRSDAVSPFDTCSRFACHPTTRDSRSVVENAEPDESTSVDRSFAACF